MIKVFGKPIRVNKASTDKKTQDVGANLFIGNLDVDVDEKVRRMLGRMVLNMTLAHRFPIMEGGIPTLFL